MEICRRWFPCGGGGTAETGARLHEVRVRASTAKVSSCGRVALVCSIQAFQTAYSAAPGWAGISGARQPERMRRARSRNGRRTCEAYTGS